MPEISFVCKAVSRFIDGADDCQVEQFCIAIGPLQKSGMQPDIQDMHLSDPGLVLGHQKRRFIYLETEGMRRADDGIAFRALADEQTTGDIDGKDLIAACVEMLHQGGSYPLQLAVEPRAE